MNELYWDAFKDLAIEQVQQAAKSWIKHGKHFPKPADLLDRFKEMEQAKPKPGPENLPPMPKWLGLVNGLFLKYLEYRRSEKGENFEGDLDVKARRVECLSLAAWFEDLEREGDASATEEDLKVRFDRAMARIPDRSTARDWLAVQLEFQRRQDQEHDRKRA